MTERFPPSPDRLTNCCGFSFQATGGSDSARLRDSIVAPGLMKLRTWARRDRNTMSRKGTLGPAPFFISAVKKRPHPVQWPDAVVFHSASNCVRTARILLDILLDQE